MYTYLGGCYGPDWKFGGVKKRCEMVQKRCEDVDAEEFSNENSCKPYIVWNNFLGGCYGSDWKFGGVKIRYEMVPK